MEGNGTGFVDYKPGLGSVTSGHLQIDPEKLARASDNLARFPDPTLVEEPPCEKAPSKYAYALGAILLTFIALAMFFAMGTPTLVTEYSAVRLVNGETYYGRLSGLGSKFPVMTDVFTISQQLDTAHGTTGSVMQPRANEFHNPTKLILNSEQIVFVESVTAASQVGQLIKKMPRK